MATLASTLVSDKYVNTFDANGFLTEVWQVASGNPNTPDTCVITPNKGRFIVNVQGGPTTNNLATDGSSTNVTLTLVGGTITALGAFMVSLTTKQ